MGGNLMMMFSSNECKSDTSMRLDQIGFRIPDARSIWVQSKSN